MLAGAAATVMPALMVPAAAALAVFGGKGKDRGSSYIPSAEEVCDVMEINPSRAILCSSSDVTVSAPAKGRSALALFSQADYKIHVMGSMIKMAEDVQDYEFSLEMTFDVPQKKVVSWFMDAGFNFKLL
jgi:hypothetical protein